MATNLVNGLGGTVGFGENVITRNDDGSTFPVSLTDVFGAQGLNFFGTSYTQIGVNPPPTEITVRSSLGASVTVPVTVRP